MEIGENMASVGVFGGTHGTVRWTLQVLRFARSKPLGATGLLILIAALIVALTSQIIAPQDPGHSTLAASWNRLTLATGSAPTIWDETC
jgi:hypothetical protein